MQVHESELRKIERVSQMLEILFSLAWVASVALPIVYIWLAATTPNSSGPSFFRVERRYQLQVDEDDLRAGRLTVRDKVAAGIGGTAVMGALALALWYAIRLMRQFKTHQVFTTASVELAKRAANAYLACLVVFAAVNWSAGIMAGGFRLGSGMVTQLVSLGLCWMFVWILQIGTTLYAENELTV